MGYLRRGQWRGGGGGVWHKVSANEWPYDDYWPEARHRTIAQRPPDPEALAPLPHSLCRVLHTRVPPTMGQKAESDEVFSLPTAPSFGIPCAQSCRK